MKISYTTKNGKIKAEFDSESPKIFFRRLISFKKSLKKTLVANVDQKISSILLEMLKIINIMNCDAISVQLDYLSELIRRVAGYSQSVRMAMEIGYQILDG